MMKVVVLENGICPKREYEGAAAYDLYNPSEVVLDVGLLSIPLRIKIQLPKGHFGRIACRSSFGANNCSVEAGIIDEDYTGEIVLLLRNHGPDSFTIPKGRAVAQLLVLKYETPNIEIVTSLEDTTRGERGFGSTDKPPQKKRRVFQDDSRKDEELTDPVHVVESVAEGIKEQIIEKCGSIMDDFNGWLNSIGCESRHWNDDISHFVSAVKDISEEEGYADHNPKIKEKYAEVYELWHRWNDRENEESMARVQAHLKAAEQEQHAIEEEYLRENNIDIDVPKDWNPPIEDDFVENQKLL